MCLHIPVVNCVGQNPPYPTLRKICSTGAEYYFIPYLGKLKAGQQDFIAIVNQSSCGFISSDGEDNSTAAQAQEQHCLGAENPGQVTSHTAFL